MLFVATHSYNPPSPGFKFFIVMLPPMIIVFPVGKGIPSLVQFNKGGGKPSALHVTCKVEYCFGVVTDGGTEVKMGRPTYKQ